MCSCHLASLATGHAPECLSESCTREPDLAALQTWTHRCSTARTDPSLDLLLGLLHPAHTVLSCLCNEHELLTCFHNFVSWDLQILFWKSESLSSSCSACLVTGCCSATDTGPSTCLHWTSQGAFLQPVQVWVELTTPPTWVSLETSWGCSLSQSLGDS